MTKLRLSSFEGEEEILFEAGLLVRILSIDWNKLETHVLIISNDSQRCKNFDGNEPCWCVGFIQQLVPNF